jgi:predicted DNA-binding protein with PD1-like motif
MAYATEIRHPGQRATMRRHIVPVHLERRSFRFRKGEELLAAIARTMDEAGFDSAMILLDGLVMGPYDYVIPDWNSPDGRRAAWYSETRSGELGRIEQACATVGRRDGSWFFHCHAVWDSATPHQKAGHLLPGQVTIAEDAEVVCIGVRGGKFEVSSDEETGFSLFRPFAVGAVRDDVNGALVGLAPFEDVGEAALATAAQLKLREVRILGIGSLITAPFEDGEPMASLISEVVLLEGATPSIMSYHCVDAEAGNFRGTLRPGQAEVCVTFEMVVADGSV